MITPRMYQVKYDASLRTVLSNFRFTLWGPAPHHSLKNRIFFWLPARWASGFSGDHQQDHQCLWLLLCYSFILPFIACILLGIKLLLLLLRPVLRRFCDDNARSYVWTRHTNRPIPQCTCPKSRNASCRTKMCTFLFWKVYYGTWDRCIVWSMRLVYQTRCYAKNYAIAKIHTIMS